MSNIGQSINDHLQRNNAVKEMQAGFSKGRSIEDNLLILQNCIDTSFKRKNPLIVTAIDFSKAFDSVKRDKIIEVLMRYKIHPKVITAIREAISSP